MFTDINESMYEMVDRLTSTRPDLPQVGQYQTLNHLPELGQDSEIVHSAAHEVLDFLSVE